MKKQVKKEKEKNTNEKNTNEKRLIILLFVIIFTFTIINNVIINRINIRNNELITENLYTITENTKENISKIPDDKEIKIYLFEYTENDYVSVLSKKYEELGKKIVVEIKNISENEELVNKYNIKDGDILIVSEENNKVYKYNDLYSYDYNNGDIINLTEQRITNGIMQVSSIVKKQNVYILKGHEKYKINNEESLLKRYIEQGNYELKEIKLSSEDIPDDCNTLIITTAKRDFSEEEANKVKEYVNNGGNIIWLQDAYFEEVELNNINSILEMYGVEKFKSGVIFEQEKNNTIIQNPYLILPENTLIENRLFNLPSKLMFYYSTKLNFVDDEKLNELNVKKTELLFTSEKAIFKTDLSQNTMTKNENDIEGKFVIGAVLDKKINEEKNSKLIIYANNYFVTNQNVAIGKEEISAIDLYNNKELVLNSLDYLSNDENKLEIKKIMPRNYYIGIEDESIKQALIIETIIFVLLVRNNNIYKKKK